MENSQATRVLLVEQTLEELVRGVDQENMILANRLSALSAVELAQVLGVLGNQASMDIENVVNSIEQSGLKPEGTIHQHLMGILNSQNPY